MEIRIGIMNVARELRVEVADDDAETVKAEVESAVSGDAGAMWITDRDGRKIGVPLANLAYVEFGATDARTIGFGS